MKLSQLKTIVKEAVKEAIQEEMKDILLEAVRSPKQTIYETSGTPQTSVDAPGPMNPVAQSPLPTSDKMKLRKTLLAPNAIYIMLYLSLNPLFDPYLHFHLVNYHLLMLYHHPLIVKEYLVL